ncbi:MAG: DUF1292 domain-containing protein [Clostridia bacterium]|nr:DUF1292 domain-containing protein [Clostridia bacterium]
MNDFAADLLTLTDEDGIEMEFQILDTIETDEGTFLALLPVEEADDEDENGAYYILKEEIDENGESMLAEIEDEALLDRLAEIFQAHFDEMYGEDDE